MLIRDVMTRGVATVHPDTSLRDAADLMRELDVGVLPVCDGAQLRGMLTDRDITVRATADGFDPVQTRAHDAMSESAFWCYDDQDVSEAARVMDEHQIRRLPILDRQNKLVGILSLGDIAVTTGDERLAGRTLERVSEPAKPEVEIGSDDGVLHEPPDQVARRTVAGIFADRLEAERAIDDLRIAGVDAHRVGVITKDPAHAHDIAASTGAATVASAASGLGIGAILGGAAGWLIGVGALAIPGIGPVLAAGPLAAALGVVGATAAITSIPAAPREFNPLPRWGRGLGEGAGGPTARGLCGLDRRRPPRRRRHR